MFSREYPRWFSSGRRSKLSGLSIHAELLRILSYEIDTEVLRNTLSIFKKYIKKISFQLSSIGIIGIKVAFPRELSKRKPVNGNPGA